jgi:hypothetical protein
MGQNVTYANIFLVCGLGNLGQHCVSVLKEFGVKVNAIEAVYMWIGTSTQNGKTHIRSGYSSRIKATNADLKYLRYIKLYTIRFYTEHFRVAHNEERDPSFKSRC